MTLKPKHAKISAPNLKINAVRSNNKEQFWRRRKISDVNKLMKSLTMKVEELTKKKTFNYFQLL